MICHKTRTDVHVSIVFSLLSKVFQKLRTTQQSDTDSPLMAVSIMVSTFTMSVCGPLSLLSVQPGLTITTGYVSDGRSYNLHAWRLSCSTTRQQDFRNRSLDSRQAIYKQNVRRQMALFHSLGSRTRN